MKFLNKKEQVMDFKLTSYGHYMLSMGQFKPEFYAFYDDNVLYDGAYAFISESSNQINDRIKKTTPYMASQVLFEEVETASRAMGAGYVFDRDITPVMEEPRRDVFKFDKAIGDAYLEGDTNVAPAWKVVVLNGKIDSTSQKDQVNELNIPQLNIHLNYRKKIQENSRMASNFTSSVRRAAAVTKGFSDGKSIELITDDLVVYIEELNTELLVDNFDIEVFEVVTGAIAARCSNCKAGSPVAQKRDLFKRRYFANDYGRLDGRPIDDEYLSNMNSLDQNNLSFISSTCSQFSQIEKAVALESSQLMFLQATKAFRLSIL